MVTTPQDHMQLAGILARVVISSKLPAFHQVQDLYKLLWLYKSWAPCKFQFSDCLTSTCWLCFPLIPSFHLSRAPRLPCRLTLAQCWTTLIRCASPMGSISRLSHPFHLSVPPFRACPFFFPIAVAVKFLLDKSKRDQQLLT